MAAGIAVEKVCHRYWQACITQVRYRRIRSRNPREPHFDRKYLLEACKPVYIKEKFPSWQICKKRPEFLQQIPLHPYEELLAKQLMKYWEESRMICFFHVNPISADDAKQVKTMLFKQDMHIQQYNRGIVKMALKNTFYEPALKILEKNTAIVFSAEPQVTKLLKMSRKMPHYILLAGIIDDHFLSREDLQEYSVLPPLETVQYYLMNSFTLPISQISSNLSCHYHSLSRILRQYTEQRSTSEISVDGIDK